MSRRNVLWIVLLAGVAGATFAPSSFAGPTSLSAPWGKPDAVVDLRTADGVRLVRGQWRSRDAAVVGAEFRAAGPDLRPSGRPLTTGEIAPRAGAADFDDSAWEAVAPDALEGRRGTGKLSFVWYRLDITVPEKVGAFDTAGSTLVFEIVVDDYAEVWVDGRLRHDLGQLGGSVIAGYNAPNRVLLSQDVRPGARHRIAVFAVNGPLSDPPSNYVWVRSATLDFYARDRHVSERPVEVVRLDPTLDRIVPADVRLEKLAEGFRFTEGPVWLPDGQLLFSDPNDNLIYRYAPGGELSVFRSKSGYTGADIGEYGQPGSNGLALDPEGRLTICEHGNRRVTRLEKNGVLTVLADRYEGKRLNSPNDLVYRSDGALYFTDPPFGLPQFHGDPRRELPFTGVFLLQDGRLTLVSDELTGPNGLAFSPDERYLYVANWDEKRKIVMRYAVRPDGRLTEGRVFFDMGQAPEPEALDGLKVDTAGNLYVSGPGGLWVLSAEGRHLGTIKPPELPANFAWGDADARTLYMTARTGLYRMRLTVPGVRPH